MFYIEVHEYDRFTGNHYSQMGPYEDRESADRKYDAEKSKDFDYGDHYRETRMIES